MPDPHADSNRRVAPHCARSNRASSTPKGRSAVLAMMVLVTVVIGLLLGQTASGDPASKIEQKQSELNRIQSTSGSLHSQIDAMNAQVDQLIGEESHLRQQEAAAQRELDQK